MTPAERAQILVTARLLEAAGRVDLLPMGFTLIAAGTMIVRGPSPAAVAVLALGVVAKIYGVRVAFDAKLLRDVALDQLTEADLDAAFLAKAGRPWSARLRGANRLVLILGITAIAQAMGIMAMALGL